MEIYVLCALLCTNFKVYITITERIDSGALTVKRSVGIHVVSSWVLVWTCGYMCTGNEGGWDCMCAHCDHCSGVWSDYLMTFQVGGYT